MDCSNVQDVYQLCVDNKAVVLDVRTCSDFEEMYVEVPRVFHIPIENIDDRWIVLPLNRIIFVMTQNGENGTEIIDFLKQQEFDVALVKGGIKEWESNELPIVKKKMAVHCNSICECTCKKM